jgi:hypothetical protein
VSPLVSPKLVSPALFNVSTLASGAVAFSSTAARLVCLENAPRAIAGTTTPARVAVLPKRLPPSSRALRPRQPSLRQRQRRRLSALLLPPTFARSPLTPSTDTAQETPSVASPCPLSAAMTSTATGAQTPLSCTSTRTARTARRILPQAAAMLVPMLARSSIRNAPMSTSRAAKMAPAVDGSAARQPSVYSASASSRRTGALETTLPPMRPRSARPSTKIA